VLYSKDLECSRSSVSNESGAFMAWIASVNAEYVCGFRVGLEIDNDNGES
jgi:hypothetical protein